LLAAISDLEEPTAEPYFIIALRRHKIALVR